MQVGALGWLPRRLRHRRAICAAVHSWTAATGEWPSVGIAIGIAALVVGMSAPARVLLVIPSDPFWSLLNPFDPFGSLLIPSDPFGSLVISSDPFGSLRIPSDPF